ncbi:MAG TPA: hypothetical protein EYF93_01085 [Planctomycetes bacterium]|nr:hypothetical protein [Planctomycetota bacterium]
MNSNHWIHTLRTDFEKCGSLDDETFLKLLPDGGLLAALSGEELPAALLQYARVAAERPSLRHPPETGDVRTGLDDLLHEGLAEVADLLAHGVAEDLALAIAELQQWSSALESLASVVAPSRSVFRFLEELEQHAENTPLDSIACEALIRWRDERQIPEEHLIVALDTVLEQDQLGIQIELDRIAAQQENAHGEEDHVAESTPIIPLHRDRSLCWELREPLAAGADDDDGTCWDLFDEQRKSTGSVFHDGNSFWSVEFSRKAISVYLDDERLDSEDDERRNWCMDRAAEFQPREVRVKYLETGADLKPRLRSLRFRNSDFTNDTFGTRGSSR